VGAVETGQLDDDRSPEQEPPARRQILVGGHGKQLTVEPLELLLGRRRRLGDELSLLPGLIGKPTS